MDVSAYDTGVRHPSYRRDSDEATGWNYCRAYMERNIKTLRSFIGKTPADELIDSQTLQLHMGDLTGEELLVAKAAYRLGMLKALEK